MVDHGTHVPEDCIYCLEVITRHVFLLSLIASVQPVAFERGIDRSNVACVRTWEAVRTLALVCEALAATAPFLLPCSRGRSNVAGIVRTVLLSSISTLFLKMLHLHLNLVFALLDPFSLFST